MRILGTKFWGHDSAFYYLDSDEKEIFALSTERVTRIKHDRIDITVALKEFPELRPDTVIHSYGDFSDNNQDEENRKDGVISLLKEKIARDFIKPRYGSDLYEQHPVLEEFIESHPLYAEMLRIMQLEGGDIIGLPDGAPKRG